MNPAELKTGVTYSGTMPETEVAKARGGYYAGYSRRETGKITFVSFRADKIQGSTAWGFWEERCGDRLSKQTSFPLAKLSSVTLTGPAGAQLVKQGRLLL
jgi:hypothetical protein